MTDRPMSDQTRRYREGPGYDHPHYRWSPLPKRDPFTWPDGKRTAVAAFVYVEYLELDPPEGVVGDPRFGGALGSYYPDFQNYTRREYGNRVGVYRVLDILERHGIRATVCLNAMAAERHPHIVERARAGGHGFAAHGLAAGRMISARMTEAEERAHIAESLDRLEAATGMRMRGWAGQDFGESERTPRLLAEAGLTHVIDWPNDDEPYLMDVGRPFVSIPNQAEWDDAQLFAVRHVDPWRYPEIFASAFDGLHGEGGRLFGFGIHPWVFGQAFRVRYLDEAVEHLAGCDDIWRATSDEIAEWTLKRKG